MLRGFRWDLHSSYIWYSDKPIYQTRKSGLATSVLGVCIRDMKFIYVLTRWERSTSDSKILCDVIIKQNRMIVPIGMKI